MIATELWECRGDGVSGCWGTWNTIVKDILNIGYVNNKFKFISFDRATQVYFNISLLRFYIDIEDQDKSLILLTISGNSQEVKNIIY